jgi:hypothetical protein
MRGSVQPKVEGPNSELSATSKRFGDPRASVDPYRLFQVTNRSEGILPRLGPDATEAFILAHLGIGSTKSSQCTRQPKHPWET